MTQPRLSIGLPVYNGEDYLEQSLDAVLGQTFTDFELILSSNASTDRTDDICGAYAAKDRRITFYRQERNIGAAPHHDFVFRKSRGELFKWASGDDLWGRDLVARCVELLDQHPDAILAHTYTAAIDGDDKVIQALEYPLHTDASEPAERLRSMLFDGDLPGAIQADDFYGVMRADVLRAVKPHNSFYHADQVFMAEVALHGRFLQVPEWLYFRRHHDGRALQANPTISSWSRNLDPKRANKLVHPPVRLVAEYILGYFAAVRRAPLTAAQQSECNRQIRRWLTSRVTRRLPGQSKPAPIQYFGAVDALSVQTLVAGSEGHR
ncbi:glycosyltransferase [Kribbella solani]|uniref:glycosyltransferase family 2 protein n=1 Tax=Kribbella solani TaxID=236067 RepID=UPI0029A0EBA8|nr:glycosyltransferase [Kribbella solani]MDX2971269.1 glycosyltransferase [Kribbella solani]MDX3000079.1 glycosyltransferase [Kribbella solani]